MKKKITSILVLNIIVLSIVTSLSCVPAKAGFVDNMQEAKEATLALQDYITSTYPVQGNEKVDRALKAITLPLGYIVGYATFSQATYRDIMNSKNYGGIIINDSDSDDVAMKKYAEAITNNIIVSDNNISINSVGRQILDDYINYINSNSPYFYAQSIDISHSASSFSNQVLYRAIASELQAHQRDYFCLLKRAGSVFDLYFIKKTEPIAFILKRTTDQHTFDVDGISINTGNNFYYINSYNTLSENVIHKTYNTVTGYFESDSNIDSSLTVSQVLSLDYQKSFGSSFINASGYRISFTYNDYYTVKVYRTRQDWQNEVIQSAPYFISNKYYNYSNSTGDYNINSGNANNITIGDITSYINSYNQENGENPAPQQIEIYINNNVGTPDPTPTPTPTPTLNPDDPGGGSGTGGNENENTGIFDFLSRLGTVLGNLIKNLGEMLTNLIEGIVETITSVVGAIPNIFKPLIEYVFGGLPESVQAMIILGITCMVLVGIIKAFKG